MSRIFRTALIILIVALLVTREGAADGWAEIENTALRWSLPLHRCVYTLPRVTRVCNRTALLDAPPSDQPVTCDTGADRFRNTCGAVWVGSQTVESGIDPVTLEGIPEVHLVGDSTLLRLYLHLTNASSEKFVTKVAQLSDDVVNSTIRTPSGKAVNVWFHRSLHVALAPILLSQIIVNCTPRALVLLAYGPHDTSWLVFRRVMPFYRQVNLGKFSEAAKYWRKYTMSLTKAISNALVTRPPHERPVIVSREHFMANCQHPKYTKYPLLTRCGDLLNPKVIPLYRRVLKGLLASINVPTVSIDGLFPPCYMVDAGHINRWCKTLEWQYAVQAYRGVTSARVRQGGDDEPGAEPYVRLILWRILINDSFANEISATTAEEPQLADAGFLAPMEPPRTAEPPSNSFRAVRRTDLFFSFNAAQLNYIGFGLLGLFVVIYRSYISE